MLIPLFVVRGRVGLVFKGGGEERQCQHVGKAQSPTPSRHAAERQALPLELHDVGNRREPNIVASLYDSILNDIKSGKAEWGDRATIGTRMVLGLQFQGGLEMHQTIPGALASAEPGEGLDFLSSRPARSALDHCGAHDGSEAHGQARLGGSGVPRSEELFGVGPEMFRRARWRRAGEVPKRGLPHLHILLRISDGSEGLNGTPRTGDQREKQSGEERRREGSSAFVVRHCHPRDEKLTVREGGRMATSIM